jgi:hypothetical protein
MTNADTYNSIKERYKLILCNISGVNGRHYSGVPSNVNTKISKENAAFIFRFDPEIGNVLLRKSFSIP